MAHDGPHIVPKSILLAVFGGLLSLTGLTVGVAYLPLGPLDVPVAIAIAATKAILVVLFFMHLKYDNPVNALTFAIGSIFVVVFVAVTLLGYGVPRRLGERERQDGTGTAGGTGATRGAGRSGRFSPHRTGGLSQSRAGGEHGD